MSHSSWINFKQCYSATCTHTSTSNFSRICTADSPLRHSHHSRTWDTTRKWCPHTRRIWPMDHRVPCPLLLFFTPPYQVMEKTDSIYVIEDLVSGNRTTTHIHNLRPFNYNPAYTSPLIQRLRVHRWVHHHPPWEPQSPIHPGILGSMGWIRRDLWQLGTIQSPDPRLPTCKHNEDAHPKRTQVATENLSISFYLYLSTNLSIN
jgi:hypothetical protein